MTLNWSKKELLSSSRAPASRLLQCLVRDVYTPQAGAKALARAGAHVVIAGRIADPALFLSPLVHQFGWALDDWTALGRGTLAGHLMECGMQITGGYFADPGRKDVPDLARLGFPFADVWPDGRAILGKPEGSGGRLDLRTAKEQLL